MANRFFQQFRYSLEKSLVDLYCNVTVGATGAPTVVTANSKGILSVVRNSAGKYTITLQDPYYKFLGCTCTLIGTGGAVAAPQFFVVSQAVSTAATPTVVVQFENDGGTATDPDSGEEFILHITVGNSSAY